MQKVPQNVVEKIQDAREKGLKKLDLSTSWDWYEDKEFLDEIPDEVFSLQNLEELNLTNNLLTLIPDTIVQLRNLKQLKLDCNQLSEVPEVIARLPQLTVLELGKNKISVIPEWLAGLKNLKRLDLSDCNLSSVPEWIPQLPNLKSLILLGNSLSALPPSIINLQNLRELNLSNNQFTTIPDVVFQLRSLEKLYLDNYLGYIAGKGDIQLDYLNDIREIPSKILQLSKLKEFSIPVDKIEYPPLELITGAFQSIDVNKLKNFFEQIEREGKDYLYEAKLLIVGEGGAGKTSLAKKIENPNYQLQEKEDSTKGIEVIRWHFQMENGQPFRVNIWDFGGQEIYHATHQFFLTKRSLYILVADTRKEDTDFHYWLNVVELLSDSSPLLIIKNEKQGRQRDINERQLRGQFASLEKTLATNLADNRGLDKILDDIKYYVTHLPHIGAPLPKTWVKVRERLENDSRNYISYEEYLKICEENGFTQLKDKEQLSSYLHDLGVCLHFQNDPLLSKTVILKPRWGTDAVYKVLDDKTVIGKRGRFNRDDLKSIWNALEYATMQYELLQLMINFKLCYRIPNSEFYIAPQLLTENQPHYDWDETDNLILRYTYEFMPKGIITQFIVAMNTLIANQDYVWKSGVILENDQTWAEVIEYYSRREIKIRVTGKLKKELMTIVIYELNRIHASYKQLKYSKLIPCNCPTCKHSQEPHFYPLETLRQFVEKSQNSIQCLKGFEMVNVRALIDDVIDKGEVLKGRLKDQITREGDVVLWDIDTLVINQGIKMGDSIIQKSSGGNIMQKSGRDSIIQGRKENKPIVRSAWANGSFYLLTFAVVIAGLGVLANTVPWYALAAILIAGILFVPLIGFLQLRQDDRLSEKSFGELMKLVVGQLPLIKNLTGQAKQLPEGEGPSDRSLPPESH